MKILNFLFLMFFFSSCSAGLVIGRSNRQYQETKTSVSSDSSYVSPTLTIN